MKRELLQKYRNQLLLFVSGRWVINSTLADMRLFFSPLTIKDGTLVVVGALGAALLPELLVSRAAGDVGLDVEAVALADVQVGQLDHARLEVFRFLQKGNQVFPASCRKMPSVRPSVRLLPCRSTCSCDR